MEKINVVSNRDRSIATNTTTSSSSNFVLQWGNRKRLRCMKVQQQQTKDTELAAAATMVSGTPSVGLRSITARVDRRVVRCPNNQNKQVVIATNAFSNGNGHINLRKRSSSPAQWLLR